MRKMDKAFRPKHLKLLKDDELGGLQNILRGSGPIFSSNPEATIARNVAKWKALGVEPGLHCTVRAIRGEHRALVLNTEDDFSSFMALVDGAQYRVYTRHLVKGNEYEI